jgi:hypothetical protein
MKQFNQSKLHIQTSKNNSRKDFLIDNKTKNLLQVIIKLHLDYSGGGGQKGGGGNENNQLKGQIS